MKAYLMSLDTRTWNAKRKNVSIIVNITIYMVHTTRKYCNFMSDHVLEISSLLHSA